MTVQLSLSTGCLAHLPLRCAFRLASECGFDGLELVRTPAVAMLRSDHIRRLSDEYRLPVLSVHPSVIPYPGYDRAARILPGLVELARRLASPLVVVHTPKTRDPGQPHTSEFIDALLREKERALPSVAVTVENAGLYGPEDTRYYLHDVHHLRDLADQYDVSLTFDTSHAGTTPEGLIGSYELLCDRVVNIHLSDLLPRRLRPNWKPLQTVLVHHQMPGQGTLPLAGFLHRLAEDNYSGVLTLEPSPVALHAYSLARAEQRLQQAVTFVRHELAGPSSSG